jgi:ribosomal protein S18 acetylase RimI-like enzyme
MNESERSLAEQVQSYLREAVKQRRKTEQIGPFLATFSARTKNRFRNYAIPDDDARPNRDEIQRLIEAYNKRDRIPRLEYLPSMAPAVEEVLLDAKFVVEARLPVMTLSPENFQDKQLIEGLNFMAPESDKDLHATARVQNEIFGERETTHEDVARLKSTLESNGGVVALYSKKGDRLIGAGLHSVIVAGTTEIGSLGVLPEFEHSGAVEALCIEVAKLAFARGASAIFLEPTAYAEAAQFRRVGFVDAAESLHISYPQHRI